MAALFTMAETMSKPLGSTVLKTVKLLTEFCGFNSHRLRAFTLPLTE